MADGGQRLLDVIDDPNALESFLGGLTEDTELLPSAETVDNVVASLARSLDENEYEVDSPNETLFDTLDSSSNHLTDISRSYVPSDFGHVAVQNDAFTNNLDGFSNGNSVIRGNLQQHPEQQTPVETSGCDQFIGSSSNTSTIINSVISASPISNSTNVTASNLKLITASVSNCDPSKSSTNFVQPGQLQLTQNSVSSASNSLNFTFSQDLHKHNISVSQNELNQVTSLSSVSVEGQIQQNIPSNSTNNLISIVGSGNENGVSTLANNTSNFQVASNQQSGQTKAHNVPAITSHSTSANIQATSSASSVANVVISNDAVPNHATTLSTSTNVVGSASIQPSHQHFVTTSSAQQHATVNQLVSGQTVSIPNMTVSASQLIANSQGGLVATSAGQNILQQIQSAGAGQSYIAMEQPTALIATGPTTFGTNVALVATGGTPAYAVLPATPQFLTNAIIPQPHTIQTLTKTANGTYFQTAGTPQIVATSNVNTLQNVSVANATSDVNSSTILKPKHPPQLLPKPYASQVSTSVTTNAVTTPPVSSVSSSTESSSSGVMTAQTSLPVSSSPAATAAVTDGVVAQIIQQPQQQITSVSGAAGTVAITPQQSFAIGNTASIGQVVVSQVSSLSTMTTPQQAQLAGTIVVNQYGQPMLLPTASTAQAGALQLILRQQPTQPQVLTIQAPTGAAAALSAQATATTAAAAAGKPIVRYVSQVPQVAQTSGYGLQQIQTANGPAWVAVRYPQPSQASQFGQIQGESIVAPTTAIQNQIATTPPQIQLQTQQSQQVQLQLQQQQQQAQQLIHQTQQQQQAQIQIQGGLTQTTSLSAQQQIQAPAGVTHIQMQAHQQLSLQPQTQPQVQLGGQQGHLQQLPSQPQGFHQQIQVPPGPIPVELQNSSTPTQQNQFSVNRSGQAPMLNQSTPQLVRDVEQQQISVPDSSSEPPPPKKAKTKSKSSKKKVTLDLEQLLKQSGIMDEDLNDDMSFDFGFESSMMDTQLNGLSPSPQMPPAQIPVINTTETPKKSSSKKSKSNAKKSPTKAPPPPPPPPPPIAPPPTIVTTPSPKPAKKRSPPKKKNAAAAPPPTPPPPVLPPPPPPVVTPTKSKGGGSKKKSGSSGSVKSESQKSEPKTASSKKTAPPKKISSLDTLLATIDAVAAAAGRASSPMQVFPSPPPPLPPPPPPPTTATTPSRKPTPSPKNKGSKSKSKKSPAAPSPAKIETVPLPIANLPQIPTASTSTTSILASQSTLPTPTFSQPHSASVAPSVSAVTTFAPSNTAPLPATSSPIFPPRVTSGPNLTNGSTSVTTSQTGLTRVVQTIQLTPQNQQLLQNIQAQIQRLLALQKRSESEQSALHKLVVLQQQVIATGIPVPNPAHLNNLAQSVNVEPISMATPSGTVPSSDTTTTASSSANAPFSFPFESDANVNPVSSTVVTTASVSVLPCTNNAVNSARLGGVKLVSGNGSLPVTPKTGAATAAGVTRSNNGAAGIIVGSPSVSSTASPDSTSNLTTNLNIDQSNALSSTIVANAAASTTANLMSSGGVGNIVVSNVKGDLGQLVAPVSVASSDDKTKENTHGKGPQQPQGVAVSTAVPVSTSSSSSVSFSQHLHHVPPSSPFVPPTFTARPAVDDKKAEEQRLANQKAEEEKRARWKKEEFDMLLQRDQQYVVKPDYEVPFGTKEDAVQRLMKYHIYRDRNDMDFEEFDAEFGNNAGILLDKFSVMMSKYQNLLLKESCKEVGCAERVMLERMFVSEEKIRLEQDRLSVAQGDILELPPPPDSWVPKIKEMVDKEMTEFEPQDPVVSQQVQSAVDSIIGCESNDTSNYMLEEGDKIEYDAFGVPINSSGYAGLTSASSADIDEAVRSILT